MCSRFLASVVVVAVAIALGVGSAACGAVPLADAGPPDLGSVVVGEPEVREPCADRNPLRNVYFGDLHVHTALSFDAVPFEVRARPRDAYAFARGEPIGLPPLDEDGQPTRVARLAPGRALDFAAVTDHAEFLAEVPLCWAEGSPAYDTSTCRRYREGEAAVGDFGPLTSVFLTSPPRRPPLCNREPELCRTQRLASWAEVREAAEEAYDRTRACRFTSLLGWEWTASPAGTNLHRNVIFRSAEVPAVPTSYVEAPTPEELWDALDATCRDTGTSCDALVIPHNSNFGAGRFFVPETSDGDPLDAAGAARRGRAEPLVEVYQHKGSSECLTGLADPLASEDELCRFEEILPDICRGEPGEPEDCADLCRPGDIGFLGGCVAPSDFVRTALKLGLGEWSRVGANPFELGFIGSSDTHAALAGGTDEATWPGHYGTSDDEPEEALDLDASPLVRGFTTSPGGLAAVWAEENSREALFDALRRREAYATSGTRIAVRFFGGFDLPSDLCDGADLVTRADEAGVPMGGVLRADGASTGPTFVVNAGRDPDSAPLQRIQIVKGWLDPDGSLREAVLDVAGDPDNGATVDLDTCTPSAEGFPLLCATYQDDDYDPTQPAFYYARVLENPTCRWSQYVCQGLELDCEAVGPEDPLFACCDPRRARTVQERAWTSPIFVYPGEPGGG
ncbi:MAG: DUF3604 domain-containing protein [Sandaracinaceae bacterium]